MKKGFQERNKWLFDVKMKVLKSGNSRVFKEWNRYCGIQEDEFIEALKWLAEDPRTPLGRPTRAVGITLNSDGFNKVYADKYPDRPKAFPYDDSKIRSEMKKLECVYQSDVNSYGDPVEHFVGTFDPETGIRRDISFRIDIEDRI